MDFEDRLFFYSVTMILLGALFYNIAYAQSAVGGVNNAFDGVTENLRFFLDGIRNIELFFENFSCHFSGMFGGYHNLPEGSICL